MNQYRCETCEDISCECNPKQEGIQFSPNWIFTRKYGCASHSSFKRPSGKKNYFGGECICNKFVNCHDCRDTYAWSQKPEEQPLSTIKSTLKLTSKEVK